MLLGENNAKRSKHSKSLLVVHGLLCYVNALLQNAATHTFTCQRFAAFLIKQRESTSLISTLCFAALFNKNVFSSTTLIFPSFLTGNFPVNSKVFFSRN